MYYLYNSSEHSGNDACFLFNDSIENENTSIEKENLTNKYGP